MGDGDDVGGTIRMHLVVDGHRNHFAVPNGMHFQMPTALHAKPPPLLLQTKPLAIHVVRPNSDESMGSYRALAARITCSG